MFTHLFRILKYGTSYAIATGFFPKDTAKKVLLLYSFVRIPDNIVDDQINHISLKEHYTKAKVKLKTLRDERTAAYTNNDRSNPIRGQYVTLFKDNDIPFQYSIDFYKAMIDDCTIHRYKTYEQLE
jgi:phytoene/squalene synthetase